MKFLVRFKKYIPTALLCAPAYGFAGTVGQSQFEIEPRLFLGLNASQVNFKTNSQEYRSDGYNGYSAGGGLAFIPRKTYALEIDGIYSARVFGFGSSKVFFNCLQVPVSAYLKLGPVSFGGGAYASFWRKGGKIQSSDTTTSVSVEDIGSQSFEYGTLWLINYKTPFKALPLRIEFRAYNSINNFAKTSGLTGEINEYQLLISLDFGLSELERIRMKLYGQT